MKQYKQSDFDVGDTIIIHSAPNLWSSACSNKSPITGKYLIPSSDYPLTFVIEKVLIHRCLVESIAAGGYGWDLEALIKDNLITKVDVNTSIDFHFNF